MHYIELAFATVVLAILLHSDCHDSSASESRIYATQSIKIGKSKINHSLAIPFDLKTGGKAYLPDSPITLTCILPKNELCTEPILVTAMLIDKHDTPVRSRCFFVNASNKEGTLRIPNVFMNGIGTLNRTANLPDGRFHIQCVIETGDKTLSGLSNKFEIGR